MVNRPARLKLRRGLRLKRRRVEDISQQAEEHLEQHFFRRLHRLWEVRRFIAAWFTLLALLVGLVALQSRALSPYYQKLQPVPGGTYTEGILGAFTNANPLYATSSVDSAVSRLVFASLFKFDSN